MVVFTQTGTLDPSILESHGISSVTRSTTGAYKVVPEAPGTFLTVDSLHMAQASDHATVLHQLGYTGASKLDSDSTANGVTVIHKSTSYANIGTGPVAADISDAAPVTLKLSFRV